MSPLKVRLIEQIKQTGPIALSDYMAQCLMHPEFGYYTSRNPFGTQGDFITAPEMTQMFGELIGLSLAQYWQEIGAPNAFILAELGPGTGTLIADILRATKSVPGFLEAARIRLIEGSPTLRARQKQHLQTYDILWKDNLYDLEPLPLFLVANEFFDALPIRQFCRHAEGWSETMIGIVKNKLVFGHGPTTQYTALKPQWDKTKEGDIVETCPSGAAIARDIGHGITQNGGLALIIDYGGTYGRNDTFQALRNHAYTDPLENPGQADLTAHVDFAGLAAASQPAVAYVMEQGKWLNRLGISARARALAPLLAETALENHWAATKRLTDHSEMGSLFKVLALTAPKAPLAPGFA